MNTTTDVDSISTIIDNIPEKHPSSNYDVVLSFVITSPQSPHSVMLRYLKESVENSKKQISAGFYTAACMKFTQIRLFVCFESHLSLIGSYLSFAIQKRSMITSHVVIVDTLLPPNKYIGCRIVICVLCSKEIVIS